MFIAICSLILVLFVKQFTTEKIIDTKEINKSIPLNKLVDAINISITSYGFFNKMFPVFAEMENSTYKNRMLTIFLALLFCLSVYVSFAYLALNIYGSNIEVSIFDQFAKDDDLLTFGVVFLFFIVFISSIPYNFFPGKLCIMNILLEYNKGSFSKALEARVKANKEKQASNQ